MAQRMRGGEETVEFSAGTHAVRRRSAKALDRLADAAALHHDSASFVALLLESVADAAERHQVRGAMPGAERDLWEGVGAQLDNSKAVVRSDVLSAEAFAALLARSTRGDAAVAAELDVDRSRISQRLSERSLYAVSGPDDRYYPRWQFEGGKVLRGMRAVLPVLDAGLHPLSVDRWFTSPSLELVVDGEPLTPVSWLATGGEIQAVVQLAADV